MHRMKISLELIIGGNIYSLGRLIWKTATVMFGIYVDSSLSIMTKATSDFVIFMVTRFSEHIEVW